MKYPLGAGVVGLVCLALLLPVIGPCLCPANPTPGTHDCCPVQGGFELALSKSDCCVAPAARPPSAAEATGTFPAPFVALPVLLAVGDDGHAPIVAQGPLKTALPPGAAPPAFNLRI